jgi:hypothetical protein
MVPRRATTTQILVVVSAAAFALSFVLERSGGHWGWVMLGGFVCLLVSAHRVGGTNEPERLGPAMGRVARIVQIAEWTALVGTIALMVFSSIAAGNRVFVAAVLPLNLAELFVWAGADDRPSRPAVAGS